MVKFPNAKINLGLNVVEKRSDGYHNIESVFYPVKLYDVLEIVKSDELGFYFSGKKIEGRSEDNLCYKAYKLIKEKHQITPVTCYLNKILPMGAGMGGGSADAAFTLLILNELFELNLSNTLLKQYALQLGSDCPFFIDNKPAYVQGRGEISDTIDLNLDNYTFLFVNTGLHISTAEAYSAVVPVKPKLNVKDIVLNEPLEKWKNYLQNDFEPSAFNKHQDLIKIKHLLYESGALYASMTGSGSAFYGIFSKMDEQAISILKIKLYDSFKNKFSRVEILSEVYLH